MSVHVGIVFFTCCRFVELFKTISDIMLTRPDGPEMITVGRLQEVNDIIVVLSPLEIEMSAENFVTISKVLPIVSCLTNGVSSQLPKTELRESFKVSVIGQLQKRFGNLKNF